jgi:hypothetical protein
MCGRRTLARRAHSAPNEESIEDGKSQGKTTVVEEHYTLVVGTIETG